MTARPIGRPVALGVSASDPGRRTESEATTTTKVVLSPTRLPRITTARAAQISHDLTELDRAVAGFVRDVRLCSGGQLVRRFWPGGESDRRRAARALRRLADWQVLERLPRQIGGVRAGSQGYLYALGPAGVRILAAGQAARRRDVPGERHIAHTVAATEVVVALHQAQAAGRLELLEVQSEPACWRGFQGPLGARLTLKPDLFVRVGVGSLEDRWQIEVDLATESVPTIREKARRYVQHFRAGTEQARHGVYPRTLWAAPTDQRCQQITRALGGLPPATWELFRVCRLDQVTRVLETEAAS